jgi:hypothetical protein
MQRYTIPGLAIVAIFSIFWAYTIADTLIRDMHKDVTYIDLGTVFILGLIAGLSFAFAIVLGVRKKEPKEKAAVSG